MEYKIWAVIWIMSRMSQNRLVGAWIFWQINIVKNVVIEGCRAECKCIMKCLFKGLSFDVQARDILLWEKQKNKKNSKKTFEAAVKSVIGGVGKLLTRTWKCRPYRKDDFSGNMLQGWERIVSGGLSYKAGDLSRSSGGWEDDIAWVWKVDDLTPLRPLCRHAHTHTRWLVLI